MNLSYVFKRVTSLRKDNFQNWSIHRIQCAIGNHNCRHVLPIGVSYARTI